MQGLVFMRRLVICSHSCKVSVNFVAMVIGNRGASICIHRVVIGQWSIYVWKAPLFSSPWIIGADANQAAFENKTKLGGSRGWLC